MKDPQTGNVCNVDMMEVQIRMGKGWEIAPGDVAPVNVPQPPVELEEQAPPFDFLADSED